MYRSFPSYCQLKEYLSILIESGLIERFLQQTNSNSNGNSNNNGKALYKITEKGLRLLHISQEIESLIGMYWEHKAATVRTNPFSKM
jgi:predicted transcriptional regulator